MIQRNKNLIQLNKLAGYSPAIFYSQKIRFTNPKIRLSLIFLQ